MIRSAISFSRSYGFKMLRETAHFSRFLLARIHSRRLTGVKFIGITGSAGKTTTKDLAAAILSDTGSCHSSPRSMNYPDGIAKILLKVNPKTQFCVLEVSGANPGELDRPLRLFTPDIAVLTLVARDHFKAFRSVEAIAAEKSKLVKALPKDGTAVLNIDDPLVRAIGENCGRRVVWIGEGEGATLRLRSVRSRWPEPLILDVEYEGELFEIRTQLHGKHLALSVLAALGVGLAAGIPLDKAISALADVRPPEGRMEVVRGGDGVVFLRDDWKAPHWSLGAPLDFMRDAQAQRKVLVIGTLSDYSLSASKLYPKVARQALEVGDLVVFVGPHALRAMKAQRHPEDEALRAYTDIQEAAAFLAEALRPGDLVLLKGSNKADHLVRLVYHRQKPVQCWAARCGIQDFCGDCSRLYKAASLSTGTSAVEPAATVLPPPQPAEGPVMPVVVGLGNPGPRYRNTPHNAGYRVLDRLADTLSDTNGGAWEDQPEGSVCVVDLEGILVRLFKPGVSMNNCGPAVQQFLARTGSDPRTCIVVHDDMDIALGEARVKHGGSDAGHKGMKSLISSLASADITRVRVGVRLAGDTRKARQIVLSRFSNSEEMDLQEGIEQAVLAVQKGIQGLTHQRKDNSDKPVTIANM